MEVAPPINPTDFNFNSSLYTTVPPTPRLMNNNNEDNSKSSSSSNGNNNSTAPTSPDRISKLYHDFDQLAISGNTHHRTNSLATVPFAWEDKPGVPKSTTNLRDVDFAFDLSGELYPDSPVSAEDLFQGGLIKPVEIKNLERQRGREGKYYSGELSSSRRSRRTRSLPPPLRGSEPPSVPANKTVPTTSSMCTTLSASGSGKGSKKWSFKDLFLFRSASDGRALDKDPLKKYSAIFRKRDEDSRNSSLRRHGSGSGSGSGSGLKRRGQVSAHELHYTVNRAVSNDMKKKTFLPYKQGILGRLAFNPTVHALSNGFGFSHNN